MQRMSPLIEIAIVTRISNADFSSFKNYFPRPSVCVLPKRVNLLRIAFVLKSLLFDIGIF